MLGIGSPVTYLVRPFLTHQLYNPMDINLKQAADFMLANDYILPLGKGKFKLSTKFHRDYAQLKDPRGGADLLDYHGISTASYAGVHVEKPLMYSQRPSTDWEQDYKDFIVYAKVPSRLEAKRGESYPANTYSEDGMKAFRKAIEQGYDWNLMVNAVILYYKSSIKFKMAIGRFMEEGHWKTNYDELSQAAKKGVEAINDLVTEQTKDTDVDHYGLG